MRVFYFTLSQILFSIEKKISFLFLFLFTFNLANSQLATWTSTCDGSTASSTASGFTSIPIDISHDCAVSCLSTTEGSLVGDQQNETTVNDQSFSFGITNNTTKKKNTILAMPAAPAAIPPNPKMAAMTAIIKNQRAKRNMIIYF